MTELFGLRVEEIDALYDNEKNAVEWNGKEYSTSKLCERIHLNTATALAVYKKDFYQSEPAFCVNDAEKGISYYLAADMDKSFYFDFYQYIADSLHLSKAVDADLPEGVTATVRHGTEEIIIIQNLIQRRSRYRFIQYCMTRNPARLIMII